MNLTFEEWWAELQRLAAQYDLVWLLTTNAEDYRDDYEEGLTPAEELNEQLGAL